MKRNWDRGAHSTEKLSFHSKEKYIHWTDIYRLHLLKLQKTAYSKSTHPTISARTECTICNTSRPRRIRTNAENTVTFQLTKWNKEDHGTRENRQFEVYFTASSFLWDTIRTPSRLTSRSPSINVPLWVLTTQKVVTWTVGFTYTDIRKHCGR